MTRIPSAPRTQHVEVRASRTGPKLPRLHALPRHALPRFTAGPATEKAQQVWLSPARPERTAVHRQTQGFAPAPERPGFHPRSEPMSQAVAIDWDGLRATALEAMHRAYAPYSRFPVGVAGLVDDGRIVSGCNVENAAYGVALCAECGMVSQLHLSGGGRLVAVSCVNGNGDPLTPCGRCRQLLWEHGGPNCQVMTSAGVRTMAEVLPDAFGGEDLDEFEATQD